MRLAKVPQRLAHWNVLALSSIATSKFLRKYDQISEFAMIKWDLPNREARTQM